VLLLLLLLGPTRFLSTAGALSGEFCDDPQDELVLRAQLLAEVEEAMGGPPPGGIGATAGWMVNLGAALFPDDESLDSVRLDDAAVQRWFAVVAEVLQANDPLQLPLYVLLLLLVVVMLLLLLLLVVVMMIILLLTTLHHARIYV
jgi:hypothetical protein